MISLWMSLGAALGAEPVIAGGPGRNVEVKRRSVISIPSSVEGAVLVRCVIQAEIDTQGRAIDAAVVGCPEPIASSAREAFLKWRWEPPTLDGVPARGRTIETVEVMRLGPNMPANPVRPAQCDYQLAVSDSGALSPAPLDPTKPCAAVFPDQIAPPPVPVHCTFTHRFGAKLALEQCPPEAHAWLEELIRYATFSEADRTSLRIDTP